MKTILLLAAMALLTTGSVRADTLYLQNGKVVKGDIMEDTPTNVRIKVRGTPYTYARGEIKDIVYGDEAPVDQLGQTRRLLKDIPQDKIEIILRVMDANGSREGIRRIFSKIIAEAPAEAQPELQKMLVADTMIERLIPIYDSYFTLEELKEMLNFYKSPTGQKLVGITPRLMEETIKETDRFFKEKAVDAGEDQ